MKEYRFVTAKELLGLCEKYDTDISEIMLRKEVEYGERSRQRVLDKLDESIRVMDVATKVSAMEPTKSMGGLIGGESKKVNELPETKAICGKTMHKAIMSALSVSEVNASMGVIVAAPTAGAAGVLPAALFSVFEDFDVDMDTLRKAFINASAIGYLIVKRGSVSGAEAGCQAEVGSASAMTASALTEMMGGTPEQCCHAASIALSNLLGLVCDPIRGLVEVPCQTRNVIGTTGAMAAAEMALSGITSPVPLDEMITIMRDVGRSMPASLRETGLGGCAAAPSVCENCQKGRGDKDE